MIMEKLEENRVRAELLRYYNSQSTAHAGYLISWAVASFALVRLLVGEEAPLLNGVMSACKFMLSAVVGVDVALFIRCVVFGILFAVLIHLVGRTLFWGYLTSYVLYAEPSSDHTLFHKLHFGTVDQLVREKSVMKSFAKAFQTLNVYLLLGSFFIFLSICLFYEFIVKYPGSPHQTGMTATVICFLSGLPLAYKGLVTYSGAQRTGFMRLGLLLSRIVFYAALFAIGIVFYRYAAIGVACIDYGGVLLATFWSCCLELLRKFSGISFKEFSRRLARMRRSIDAFLANFSL